MRCGNCHQPHTLSLEVKRCYQFHRGFGNPVLHYAMELSLLQSMNRPHPDQTAMFAEYATQERVVAIASLELTGPEREEWWRREYDARLAYKARRIGPGLATTVQVEYITDLLKGVAEARELTFHREPVLEWARQLSRKVASAFITIAQEELEIADQERDRQAARTWIPQITELLRDTQMRIWTQPLNREIPR